MNTIKNISRLMVLTLFLIACDSGFDELNTSTTGITNLDPALVLNNAIISSSMPSGTLIYEMGIVQQIISPNTGVLEGANFNKNNSTNTVAVWQNYYQNVLKYTADVIARTEDPTSKTPRPNLTNMAKIIQSNAFMVLSDTYGAVPYDNGGAGYTEQVFFPDYQAQPNVYAAIIKTLTEATAALDAGGKIETNDVLYGGNIAQWKKLGYSLLLRAGIRLSKVDATAAQSAVTTAFAGGVILANSDNAIIKHDGNYVNNIANTLNGTEAANYYLAKPFVEALKSNGDPRLSSIAVRYVGANQGSAQTPAAATTVAADQYGLPVGSTDSDSDAAGASLPSGGTRYAFSQVDRTRMAKKTAPLFIITAAQDYLMLAEANQKGWVTTGTAVDYFTEGIKAHMDQMAIFDEGAAVSATDRDAYADAMAATFAGNELQHIGYEYWIASFLNGPEAWANFRRTGYPQLTPNPKQGDLSATDFITRLTYPPSEVLVNSANVDEAIAAQGPDKLDTKVWWDK